MFDQSHGLRFDIYERIHLSEELPGIAELEEVELLPEIQVIQREDRAELYGQLLLTGLYRSEDDRTLRLEHAIPVEITVPLTRVSSIEDIGVEIENFDIDLLTMRTVNITGVLSLRGIGGTEVQPAWQQEEYTVAYSPAGERLSDVSAENEEHDNDALYENSQWTYGEGVSEVSAEDHENAEAISDVLENSQAFESVEPTTPVVNFSSAKEKDKEQKVRTHSLETESGESPPEIVNHWLKLEKKTEEPQEVVLEPFSRDTVDTAVINAAHEETSVFVSDSADSNAELHVQEALVQISEEKDASQENAPITEEKPDLKVALGSKKEDTAPAKEHFTFSSLLSSSKSRKEQEALLSEETASVAAIVDEAGNEAQWKSRFITEADGANLFRKVRLCIVQREETLDTIAEKYQLSARELVMYNRLAGQNVEEGQVLYIP